MLGVLTRVNVAPVYRCVSINQMSHAVSVKGLGRSEQGSTEHIKVKLKNDSYGLGANASYEVRALTSVSRG